MEAHVAAGMNGVNIERTCINTKDDRRLIKLLVSIVQKSFVTMRLKLTILIATFSAIYMPTARAVACCQLCPKPRGTDGFLERYDWSPRGILHDGRLESRFQPPPLCCCEPAPGKSCIATVC